MEPSTQQSSPAIPIAIICGFAMIAIAIFFTNKNQPEPVPITAAPEAAAGTIRPVDETDYIRGNPNAPILMIEYSDYDCPFCQEYHNVMKQIMDEYGITGRVAWVYRQLPLVQLHPNAPKLAEAALCVGDIGGSTAFWDFTDRIYAERNFGEPTNVTRLVDYVVDTGVSEADYVSCMNSGRMAPAVQASVADALNVGASGTPYTVLIVGNQQAEISGSQSYEFVKSVVQNLINQLDGAPPRTETTATEAVVE